MEANISEGMTVVELPLAHRWRMRTSDLLGRINREPNRRTHVATLFPNEAPLSRLATALQAASWDSLLRFLALLELVLDQEFARHPQQSRPPTCEAAHARGHTSHAAEHCASGRAEEND